MIILKIKTSDKSNIIFLITIFFLAQFAYHVAHSGFFSTFRHLDFVVDYRSIFSKPGHFWESIFYYHLSPPLYVMYAAAFYKFFPPNGEIGFYVLHSLLGIYAIYALYMIQRQLDIVPTLATFLTTVFVLSPSFNIMQASAFYDFPTACLLIISVWYLAKLLRHPTFFNAFIFFLAVALLCSIRSLYHVLIYMLPVIVITILALKKHWKIILLASILPYLLVFSVYMKNYILFDMFATSSYFGETLDSIVMQFYVNLNQREEGIKQGFFSEMALCPSTPEGSRTPTINSKYSGWYCYTVIAEKFRKTYLQKLGRNYKDIPLLSCDYSQPIAPGVNFPRRSCVGNIGMSNEYQKNALQAIWHYPHSYWQGILGALRQYFNTHISFYYEITPNKLLPQTMQWSWFRLPLMWTPDLSLSISLPFLIIFPLLCYFALCFTLYSPQGIYYCLRLYALAFMGTILIAIAHLAHFKFWRILHNWNLQAKLIVYLLAMFIGLSVSIAVLRLGILIARKFKKFNSSFNSLIYPLMDYKKRILVLYLFGNIIFTSLVIIFMVGIAQQRYRIYIDALYLILFSLLIQMLIFKHESRK